MDEEKVFKDDCEIDASVGLSIEIVKKKCLIWSRLDSKMFSKQTINFHVKSIWLNKN